MIGDLLDARQDLTGELDLAHAQRPAASGRTEAPEKKTDKLPERIEAEAARHDGVTLEMAAEKPEARLYIQLGNDFALAMSTTFLTRSEEHTSELQSRAHLVCRLLLET